MTPPKHLQSRIDEALARKRDLDERAAAMLEQHKQTMRAVGLPVREDYSNRRAYRAAVARSARK